MIPTLVFIFVIIIINYTNDSNICYFHKLLHNFYQSQHVFFSTHGSDHIFHLLTTRASFKFYNYSFCTDTCISDHKTVLRWP